MLYNPKYRAHKTGVWIKGDTNEWVCTFDQCHLLWLSVSCIISACVLGMFQYDVVNSLRWCNLDMYPTSLWRHDNCRCPSAKWRLAISDRLTDSGYATNMSLCRNLNLLCLRDVMGLLLSVFVYYAQCEIIKCEIYRLFFSWHYLNHVCLPCIQNPTI